MSYICFVVGDNLVYRNKDGHVVRMGVLSQQILIQNVVFVSMICKYISGTWAD